MAAAWLGRGNALLSSNAIAEALAAYNKALALRPSYFKALHQIAVCYRIQGDIEAAGSHYDKALAIAPDFAETVSNRIFALDFTANADFAATRSRGNNGGCRSDRKSPRDRHSVMRILANPRAGW